jgi:HlyD family secretion protein
LDTDYPSCLGGSYGSARTYCAILVRAFCRLGRMECESKRTMNDKDKNKQNESVNRRQRRLGLVGGVKRLWIILIFCAVVLMVWVLWGSIRNGGFTATSSRLSIFPVRRDDLTITVTESGSTKASQTIDIRSEVYGEATIISLIPEGTYITQEDVNAGRLLVELDSSSLKERLIEEEKGLASDVARLTEEQENYHIQQNQNESDITAAQLAVKFTLMDLQKYLGENVAQKVVEKASLDPNSNFDITSLLANSDPNDPNSLSGGSSQQLKQLKDAILLVEGQLEKANDVLEGTQKLHDANYASELELKGAKLDVERLRIQNESAVEALNLYRRYDFPKEAEMYLSDYKEAERELVRTHARARSRMAQAQARLSNAEEDVAESREDVQRRTKQVDACTIRAPAPGLVVYGTSGEPWRERERGPVREGGKVYQRQTIISLPNTSEIIVEIRVHETSVDKVRPGQHATITVDAFPDKTFQGEVLKVAPLPDSQQGFLNPDVKVYTTKVSMEGSHDYVRPGMSAKVEILVEQLEDVLIVPIQAVAIREGKKLCYVMDSDAPQPRAVSTGSFNDTFVEIISGLEVGEQVLLNPPLFIEPSAGVK